MIPPLILSLNVFGGLTTACNDVDRFASYGAKTYVLGESAELCAQSSSVDDFIAELEQDFGEDFLADGRKWVADSFYTDEPRSIAKLRLSKGWSQGQLAQKVGTTQAQISKIERGVQNVGIDTIEQLAIALEVEPTEVFRLIFAQRTVAG
ncbi:helix-turn-helix domain-containing protein [Burkholderia sp. YIM B11467]